MLKKLIKISVGLMLAISNSLVASGVMIDSRENAMNRLKARYATYNESYPGGTTTTTTAPCITQPPVTCPPVAECPDDQSYLAAILTPIFFVLGTLIGLGIGAGCMKRHIQKAAQGVPQ